MTDSIYYNGIKKFDGGDDYSHWKTRVKFYLRERHLLKFVTDPVPDIPNETWLDGNDTTVGKISKFLHDDLLHYCEGDDKYAIDVFKKLDELYGRVSRSVQSSVHRKLIHFKMEETETIKNYFSRFENLLREYKAAGGSYTEMDQIAWLTGDLPTQYEPVMDTIEQLPDATYTLEFVKHKLLEREAKIRKKAADTSLKVLVATSEDTKGDIQKESNTDHSNQKNRGNFRGKYRGRGQGGYRGKPSSYRGRGGNRGGHRGGHRGGYTYRGKNQYDRNGRDCLFCGRYGHMARECKFKERYEKHQQKKSEGSKSAMTTSYDDKSPKGHSSSYFIGMAGNIDAHNLGGIEFIIDSGATDHFIVDHRHFEESRELSPPLTVKVAKRGEHILATRIGNVRITTNTGVSGMLENVLYSPDVAENLLSVKRLQQTDFEVTFKADGSIHMTKGGNVTILSKNDNLSSPHTGVKRLYANVCNSKCDYEIWHKRLGHMSKNKFIELRSKRMYYDTDFIKNIKINDKICEACINGKQVKLPSRNSKDKSHINRPLLNIHSDICGPITPSTMDNKKYYMIFIDEYTHYCVTYLTSSKSELFYCFKDYVNKSHANFCSKNHKVVYLYIDNGKEYLSNEFKNFCIEKGITYHLTVPYTPHQNGVSERMIRSITEKARSILHESKLPKQFWGEAVLTATFFN